MKRFPIYNPTNGIPIPPMTDYQKLEYIHFALQEAMESLKQWRQYEDPELMQALEFVEDLREPYLND